MSFDTFESSVEGGTPVELFEFTIGSETPFRYTSAEDSQSVGGNTFTPQAIKRTKIEDGPRKRAGEFAIELPSSDPFVVRYSGIVPGARVSLVVSRFHRADTPTPEVQTLFDGLVESVQLSKNGHLAKVTSRASIAAITHTFPSEGYQTQCNNILYGAVRCQVDRTDPTYRALNATVDGVSGRILTVSQAGLFPDGWFQGGRATIDGDSDHRMIISHVGDQVELMGEFPSPPTIATLYAGCAHTLAICKSKFDNVLNFRGFAFVPTRNPFSDGLQ